MQITGQIDTNGNPMELRGPIEVVQFGGQLRDKETSMLWAIKDEYGDWVNALMHGMGVKSKMVVIEDEARPTETRTNE